MEYVKSVQTGVTARVDYIILLGGIYERLWGGAVVPLYHFSPEEVRLFKAAQRVRLLPNGTLEFYIKERAVGA